MAVLVAGAAAGTGVRADDLFVRHHLAPAAGMRAWVRGAAVAAEQPDREGTALWVLGPAEDVGPLLVGVAGSRARPSRLLVDHDAASALPAAWTPARTRTWHWMWTREPPDPPVREVVELVDHDELRDFLAAAYPGSFARPGDADVECWLGVREQGAVVAAGALVRRPDATGYVRAVSVLAAYRGRGLARDVSAALTRRSLAVGSGVATLGVFVDNAPALAVYRRLGFTTAHTFATCLWE